MKVSYSKFLVFLFLISLGSCAHKEEKNKEVPVKEDVKDIYEKDWASLGKHNESPDWFKEAKLGIYFHWGIYSVPAFHDEWYPRYMHLENHRVYKHHVETYGHPSEFGYHDFVPMFKAEQFDPEKWATLFKKAGAKFAGPVAEHHDGFAMWDSEITPWNAMDKGPKRDVTGELKKAFTSKGMKFITAFHHARNLQRNTELNGTNWLSHYPYMEGMPPTSKDSTLAYLYGNIPAEKWHKEVWLGKLKEVIDNYQPDIIWFDFVLDAIPENYRKEFAAYYLNEAEKLDKEVVIVRKQHDLPLSMSVMDLEQSRKNVIGTKAWMTDATISNGSWSYKEDLGVKSSTDVLHMLIDIVSKNGVLLLNVSPMASGVIPENQEKCLLEMGAWLEKYGEAIYGTEAWYTFGEGPTKEPEGHFGNHKAFHKIKYSNKDIRYTTKDYNIYGIVMGDIVPNKEILLTAFAKKNIKDNVKIESVSILGSDEKIEWSIDTKEGLKVKLPSKVVDEMATVIKIEISA